jgi:hypothetical protein
MGWRVVMLAAIWAIEQGGNANGLGFIRFLGRGLLCSRSFQKLPNRSDLHCMILKGLLGLLQNKRWDDVGVRSMGLKVQHHQAHWPVYLWVM